MCLYPKLIKNPKYTANKKNNGNVPKVDDKRKLLVPVGCGKCMECMKKKAREWNVRLNEEIKNNKNGIFVTLTFSNEAIKELKEALYEERIRKEIIDNLDGYELDNELARIGIRRFLERWRKKYKKSIRHWLITELGHNGTENIHIHGIIFTNEKEETIKEIWKYGFIWTSLKDGYVNEKTINYITKYCTKIDEKHKEYKPKIFCSSGIGKNYIGTLNSKINKYKKGKTKEYYQKRDGTKLALPIYYRNKIYTEEEREKLWIEKLDQKIRYVDGVRIDISKGEEEYYRKLKHAREKNKELGYGSDEINWERKRYERELRNLNYKKRLGN